MDGDHDKEKERLAYVYAYLLDLDLSCMAKEKQEIANQKAQHFFGIEQDSNCLDQVQTDTDAGASLQEIAFDQWLNMLINWCPDHYLAVEIPAINTAIAEACILGPSMAYQIVEWLKMI